MPSDRINRLLEEAGKNALKGCDPLNHQFLVDNDITGDECYELGQLIGNAIVGYARSSFNSRMVDNLKTEFDDLDERVRALAAWDYAVSQQKLRKTVEELSKV